MQPVIRIGVAGFSHLLLVSCRAQPEIKVGVPVAGCNSLRSVSCRMLPEIKVGNVWLVAGQLSGATRDQDRGGWL